MEDKSGSGSCECTDPNASYDTCGGCPAKCSDAYSKDTTACFAVCVRGCFCDDGYILDDIESGLCVLEKDCPVPVETTSTNECYMIDCHPDTPYCVEDTGDGTAGCVAIGDECKTCFQLGLPTRLCDDGSCGGNCGCQWGMNDYGDVVCQNNIRACMEYMFFL